jgi:hypothetical protein
MAHLLGQADRRTVTRALDAARRQYLVPANAGRWEVYQEIVTKLDAVRPPTKARR